MITVRVTVFLVFSVEIPLSMFLLSFLQRIHVDLGQIELELTPNGIMLFEDIPNKIKIFFLQLLKSLTCNDNAKIRSLSFIQRVRVSRL